LVAGDRESDACYTTAEKNIAYLMFRAESAETAEYLEIKQ